MEGEEGQGMYRPYQQLFDSADYTSLPVEEKVKKLEGWCDLGISPAKGEEYGRQLLMVGQGQSVD